MNANTEVNLDTLFDMIAAQIKAQFPALTTVEFDRDESTAPPAAPACILEMTEVERYDQDPGTEQLAATFRFEARLLTAFNVQNPKAAARKQALALAAWLHQRTWRAQGHPSGPAQIVGAYKDDFSPVLDKYEAWRVEWSQEFHLGTSVWNGEGTVPSEILVRMDPAAQNVDGSTLPDGQHHDKGEYSTFMIQGAPA